MRIDDSQEHSESTARHRLGAIVISSRTPLVNPCERVRLTLQVYDDAMPSAQAQWVLSTQEAKLTLSTVASKSHLP
jgi:hypothetical protein